MLEKPKFIPPEIEKQEEGGQKEIKDKLNLLIGIKSKEQNGENKKIPEGNPESGTGK